MTARVFPALVVVALALAGCGSHRLRDDQYAMICHAYRQGQVIGRGPAVALGFTMDMYHLDHHAAAQAVAVARTEYCP